MEEVLRRANLMAAHQRVVRNGGAPGVDGLTVGELLVYCREHWPRHGEELVSGRYRPQAVRRVMIPKPGGSERVLASLDRFIERRLRLKINRDKSAVASPWERKFLGYSFTMRKDARPKAAPESL